MAIWNYQVVFRLAVIRNGPLKLGDIKFCMNRHIDDKIFIYVKYIYLKVNNYSANITMV
jgi:hypothetical protein